MRRVGWTNTARCRRPSWMGMTPARARRNTCCSPFPPPFLFASDLILLSLPLLYTVQTQRTYTLPHTHTHAHNRIQSAVIGSLLNTWVDKCSTQLIHPSSVCSTPVQSIRSLLRHIVQGWPREEGRYARQPLTTVPYSWSRGDWGGAQMAKWGWAEVYVDKNKMTPSLFWSRGKKESTKRRGTQLTQPAKWKRN